MNNHQLTLIDEESCSLVIMCASLITVDPEHYFIIE